MQRIDHSVNNDTPEGNATLRLSIGPLRYELRAVGAWGAAALSGLADHLDCRSFSVAPERTVMYAEIVWDAEVRRAGGEGRLPAALAAILGAPAPDAGWEVHNIDTGCVSWSHQDLSAGFMTPPPVPAPRTSRYHFPWHALVHDASARGGVVVHAALVASGARAWLFTAPPGGGKTTTVSALPDGWRLLSDDACLLWPVKGAFAASPLPTWSHALGVNDMPPGLGVWQVAESMPVAGAVVLQKADEDRVAAMAPLQAVTALYRAFSEHPIVLGTRTGMRELIFSTVCSLTEAVPSFELSLTMARPEFKRQLALIRDA